MEALKTEALAVAHIVGCDGPSAARAGAAPAPGAPLQGDAGAARCVDWPAAVWEHIADYLTCEDLLELRAVCSHWRRELGLLVSARPARDRRAEQPQTRQSGAAAGGAAAGEAAAPAAARMRRQCMRAPNPHPSPPHAG
jgi:hypothetical protein